MNKTIIFGIIYLILFFNMLPSCKSKEDYIMFSVLSHGKGGLIIDELYQNKTIFYKYPDENDEVYKIDLVDSIVEKISQLKNKINFNQLKSEYTSNRQDMTIYSVYFSDKNKKIFYYHGDAPTEFEHLIKYLKSLRNLPAKKINKAIDFKTRKDVPVIRLPIPPMPNPNDTIINLDEID